MGGRRRDETDRQVEERLARLLRPGPRHAFPPDRQDLSPDRQGPSTGGQDLSTDSDGLNLQDDRAPDRRNWVPTDEADPGDQGQEGELDDEVDLADAGELDEDGPDEDGGPDDGAEPADDATTGSGAVLGSGTVLGSETVLGSGAAHGTGQHDSADRPDRRRIRTGTAAAARWRFQRPQFAVLAVVVVLGLLIGGWSVLRARPVALAQPSVVPASSAGAPRTQDPPTLQPSSPSAAEPDPAPSPATAVPEASSTPQLQIHVLGAVRKPGVVVLSPGARVQDALKAAGGVKPAAHLGDLNLAQTLADGQQIVVARVAADTQVRNPSSAPVPDAGAADGAPGGGGTGAAPGTAPAMVDLNTATPDQLDQLPGVGPVTAQKIIAWREQNGHFSTIDELQEIDGIGPKTFADLAPMVTV